MKDFFANRTPREKKLLIASVIVLTLFILYSLIWKPLADSYFELQKDIVYNQQLLTWMQDKQGMLLQSKPGAPATSGKDLFLVIDENYKKNILKEYKPEMTRLSDNKVSVKFSRVPFDDLLNVSSLLLTQYNTDITSFEVGKLNDKPGEGGMVQASVSYSR